MTASQLKTVLCILSVVYVFSAFNACSCASIVIYLNVRSYLVEYDKNNKK